MVASSSRGCASLVDVRQVSAAETTKFSKYSLHDKHEGSNETCVNAIRKHIKEVRTDDEGGDRADRYVSIASAVKVVPLCRREWIETHQIIVHQNE